MYIAVLNQEIIDIKYTLETNKPKYADTDRGEKIEVYWIEDNFYIKKGDQFIDNKIIYSSWNFNNIKEQKLKEISQQCREIIYNGLEITLSNEQKEYFSFKEEDQINLMALYNKALIDTNNENLFPYHNNGNLCKFYTAKDIIIIGETLMNYKTYHTTYCNSLNVWINSLEQNEQETLENIYYGIEIPEQYQSEVLKQLNIQKKEVK